MKLYSLSCLILSRFALSNPFVHNSFADCLGGGLSRCLKSILLRSFTFRLLLLLSLHRSPTLDISRLLRNANWFKSNLNWGKLAASAWTAVACWLIDADSFVLLEHGLRTAFTRFDRTLSCCWTNFEMALSWVGRVLIAGWLGCCALDWLIWVDLFVILSLLLFSRGRELAIDRWLDVSDFELDFVSICFASFACSLCAFDDRWVFSWLFPRSFWSSSCSFCALLCWRTAGRWPACWFSLLFRSDSRLPSAFNWLAFNWSTGASSCSLCLGRLTDRSTGSIWIGGHSACRI